MSVIETTTDHHALPISIIIRVVICKPWTLLKCLHSQSLWLVKCAVCHYAINLANIHRPSKQTFVGRVRSMLLNQCRNVYIVKGQGQSDRDSEVTLTLNNKYRTTIIPIQPQKIDMPNISSDLKYKTIIPKFQIQSPCWNSIKWTDKYIICMVATFSTQKYGKDSRCYTGYNIYLTNTKCCVCYGTYRTGGNPTLLLDKEYFILKQIQLRR